MRRVGSILLIFLTAVLAACTATTKPNEITGNNTGGVIPAALLKGQDAQTLASAHCAKYGSAARITFSQAEAGGEVVFVCESAPATGQMPAPKSSQQAPAVTHAPAPKQAPKVR